MSEPSSTSAPPPDPVAFSARVRARRDPDGAVVVDVAGALDVGAVPFLTRVVEDALADGDVVLDLAVVDFFALAGLDALASLAVAARDRGRRLRVARCSRAVLRTVGLAVRLGVMVDLEGLDDLGDPPPT